MNELRIQTCIVEDGSEMRDSRQSGDIASITEVLVSDDGFADGFGLCKLGFETLE